MSRRSLHAARGYRPAGALVVIASLVLATAAAAGLATDRLERFRDVAAAGSSSAEVLEPDVSAAAFREAYALLDEEIVESLASGGVFASTGFLQDRLDAFGEAWGGAAVRLVRLAPLTIGVFQLGDRVSAASVRVYGTLHGAAALLTTLVREGRPTVHVLPPHAGAVQFLVAWDGQTSGRSLRPLRLELARQAQDGVRVVWSTAELYRDGLVARSYSVRGQEVRIRYELHYPGWVPGCDGQTEQEDVYRLAPGTGTYTRVSQRLYDAWHRELRASAARLFTAMAEGDRTTLSGLVPDARLRQRLPARLSPEPACDAAGARHEISVAASDAQGSPWSVTFERAGPRWRVTSAAPVIP